MKSDTLTKWLVHLGLMEERLPVISWRYEQRYPCICLWWLRAQSRALFHRVKVGKTTSTCANHLILTRKSDILTRTHSMFLEPIATRVLSPPAVAASPVLQDLVLMPIERYWLNMMDISDTYCYYPKVRLIYPRLYHSYNCMAYSIRHYRHQPDQLITTALIGLLHINSSS